MDKIYGKGDSMSDTLREPSDGIPPEVLMPEPAPGVPAKLPQRIYRCHFCLNAKGHGTDFISAVPICPNCQHDGTNPDDPSSSYLTPVVVIHYTPPKYPGRPSTLSTGFLACQPTVRNGENGTRVTGDPRETNCPACKASEPFKKYGAAAAGVPAMYAIPETTLEA